MTERIVTKESYIKTRVAAGEPESGASYTWQFIASISKGDYEERSEDLKKFLGRKPENLKETIARVVATK